MVLYYRAVFIIPPVLQTLDLAVLRFADVVGCLARVPCRSCPIRLGVVPGRRPHLILLWELSRLFVATTQRTDSSYEDGNRCILQCSHRYRSTMNCTDPHKLSSVLGERATSSAQRFFSNKTLRKTSWILSHHRTNLKQSFFPSQNNQSRNAPQPIPLLRLRGALDCFDDTIS